MVEGATGETSAGDEGQGVGDYTGRAASLAAPVLWKLPELWTPCPWRRSDAQRAHKLLGNHRTVSTAPTALVLHRI